ncbi:MAG TPA: hypothetical protein VGI32_08915 [Steroidobacteraceae bacterium]|jgi:hypothetical protein
MVRSIEFNAAAYFFGYTDEWPDSEAAAAVGRAREVLAIGMAQRAIDKARNND